MPRLYDTVVRALSYGVILLALVCLNCYYCRDKSISRNQVRNHASSSFVRRSGSTLAAVLKFEPWEIGSRTRTCTERLRKVLLGFDVLAKLACTSS